MNYLFGNDDALSLDKGFKKLRMLCDIYNKHIYKVFTNISVKNFLNNCYKHQFY